MNHQKKQHAIAKKMITGLTVSIFSLCFMAYLNIFNFTNNVSIENRLEVVMFSLLIPALFLAISIGRLAKHRFFSPEDIESSITSTSTNQAITLQALIQNTLEQLLLAFITYCIWAIVMPSSLLSVVLIAALLFGIGRLLFFINYPKGAVARATGFTLTFYPSLLMLTALILYGISSFIF